MTVKKYYSSRRKMKKLNMTIKPDHQDNNLGNSGVSSENTSIVGNNNTNAGPQPLQWVIYIDIRIFIFVYIISYLWSLLGHTLYI